jgi:hypothetical protein
MRLGIELDYALIGRHTSTYDMTTSVHGLTGAELGLGVAYQW